MSVSKWTRYLFVCSMLFLYFGNRIQGQNTNDDCLTSLIFVSSQQSELYTDVYFSNIQSGRPQLLLGDYEIKQAVISPSSDYIAFISKGRRTENLTISPVEGGIQIRITAGFEIFSDLSWTSDGATLAFSARQQGQDNIDIFAIDVRGNNLVNLTNHPANDYFGDWSPDGEKILFVSDRELASGSLHIMNSDGSNQTEILHAVANSPTWSPDAQQIAFVNFDDGLDVVSTDGAGQITLIDSSTYVVKAPVWSPDGRYIAFVSSDVPMTTIDSFDIFAVDIDTSEILRITDNDIYDNYPQWMPINCENLRGNSPLSIE